jgi:iron(III) transport system substrate-binding protein
MRERRSDDRREEESTGECRRARITATVLVAALLGMMGATCAALLPACARQPNAPTPADEVVVYTALDRQFSEPILSDFTARTGITVSAVYDTESTKTVGLTNRIRAEANRPRCDVFWNNEILNTLRLKDEGLLQPCDSANGNAYPRQDRDPAGYWYGFAARARVLIVNTDLVRPKEYPTSVYALADPKWKGRTAIAKPLFGTTASHVACLFAVLGQQPAADLLDAMKANDVQIAAGNKACAELVGAGRLAFALTDTDDAVAERDAGRPVQIVFPDAGAGEPGTLLLPNTLALVRGCPHPEAGRRLIDYLLSPAVEGRLAAGPSAQIPLHPAASTRSRVAGLATVRTMNVDFAHAARVFPAASKYLEERFLTP